MEHNFLAVDCGNTRIKATLFDRDGSCVCRSFENSDVDAFIGFVAGSGASRGIMMASGKVDARMAETLRMILKEGFLLMTPATELPIGVRYENPEKLGLDRKAAAVAARETFKERQVIVVDAGTALTIDMVEGREFAGGNISAGLEMRFRSLQKFTAALPKVDALEAFDNGGDLMAFGNDTRSAIACGVVNGFVDEVAAAIFRAAEGRPEEWRVVITGGDAGLLAKVLPERCRGWKGDFKMNYEPDLIAKGLYAIYRHHENKK